MPDTLGSMRAEVQDWLGGESVPASRINGAINDAIESLWETLLLASLQVFMQGPVNIDLSAGDEGWTLVSVADPTVPFNIQTAVGATSTLPARTMHGGYTLVTESGSETLLSPVTAFPLPALSLGELGLVDYVAGAVGFNVYAAYDTTRLAKQNDEPLPFGGLFREPPEGLSLAPHLPLPPSENTTGDNIFYIRHLEYQTTGGWRQAYHAGDLDSLFIERMAATLAANSEYQRYAWDLINQRQLEIRPAAGRDFTPRYFYVVKPRRLRFDNAPLPFPSVPQVAYYRASALSDVYLTLHEFDAARGWDMKAGQALAKATRALTAMNVNRNTRVMPYMI